MESNKSEWEEAKEVTKGLKGAAGLLFRLAIFGAAILVGVWSFAELIFEITLTLVQALLLTAGVGAVLLSRLWRQHKQSK